MSLGRREFLAGSLGVGPCGQESKASFRMGVLRVRACFERDAYVRITEVVQELSRVRESLSSDAETLKRKIDSESRLAEDAKGAPDLQVEKHRQRGRAEGELRALQEAGKKRLFDLAQDIDGRIHREIRRVTALVAADLGLSLVLRVDEGRSPTEGSEAAAAGDRATVIHAATELDITPQVLARLNAEWKKAWICVGCRRKVADEKCPDCSRRRP